MMQRPKAPNLKNLNVLVVDDCRMTRTLLRSVLRHLGVGTIREASGGLDALGALHHDQPDVAIIDCVMPDLDGLELTEMLRAGRDSPNRRLPIVMCTSYSTAGILKRAVDAGVDEIITKPFSAQMVLDRLIAVLKQRRPFVEHDAYNGPCRRRSKTNEYDGPLRRTLELAHLI